MNLLEVKNICKTYGSGETAVKALKDVSFSVPKGEYVAVVGESGSGKSTLLNMIGALDTPTTGKVLIDGKDIFAMDERKLTVFRRRNIGFIFQAFNLVPELTVEQNIIFPVLLDYQKPDKKYLEELLAVLNLKERRNHLPSQLSGGQQQRVAIGRALITRPALILADEPTVVSRKRLTGYCRYRTVTSPILGGAGNEKLFKPCADLCKGAETAESDDHSVCHYFDISGDSNF